MYDISWNSKSVWSKFSDLSEIKWSSNLSKNNILKTSTLQWVEHCLECAPPICYTTCSHFLKREDGRCIRLDYGIIPNNKFSGLFNYGADIKFRKWAKLESQLTLKQLNPGGHRFLDSISHKLTKTTTFISRCLGFLLKNRKLNKALNYYRGKLISNLSKNSINLHYDAFVFECFSPVKDDYNMILEITDNAKTIYKNSLVIQNGENYHEIDFSEFKLNHGHQSKQRVRLYPENDAKHRVIITWADFVVFKTRNKLSSPDKIKCLAWDLDNTFWDGVFTESSEDNLKLKSNINDIIVELDARGILQTIVSKNNYEDVWPFIKKLGLKDYFLYPQINWNPKSQNLKIIAKNLNIGIDSFGFIDDSAFERNEVKQNLPMVRTYNENEYDKLLSYKEFDLQITELSKMRRKTYLEEQKRKEVLIEYEEDNYESFLKSCEINLEIFIPTLENEMDRCFELIQRSNQLNLSTNRYTKEEFMMLLEDININSYALRCFDKYGDYGIVGFVSVLRKGDIFLMQDFVMSCRVAMKRIEHTFIQWLANKISSEKAAFLKAKFIKTKKNGPLGKLFEDLPFEIEKTIDDVVFYRYNMEENKKDNIIKVILK